MCDSNGDLDGSANSNSATDDRRSISADNDSFNSDNHSSRRLKAASYACTSGGASRQQAMPSLQAASMMTVTMLGISR